MGIALRPPRLARHPGLVWLLMVAVHAGLVVPLIFPYPFQTNTFDSASYINQGRELLHSVSAARIWLPDFAWNPLVAAFYAVIYAPLHDSLYWLPLSEWVGRAVMFVGLWATALAVAREARLVRPLTLLMLLFIVPVFEPLLYEAPYALFAILSGLAFSLLLRFYYSGMLRHAASAGVLVGLSALTRNDGLVQFPILLLCTAIITSGGVLRRHGLVRVARVWAAVAIPFLAITGGYLVLHSLVTGAFAWETSARAYSVFELAEGYAYTSAPVATETGIARARALYGTPEENRYSVVRAISHNPGAFLHRVAHVAATSFPLAFMTYGGVLGLLVFAFAGLGATQLIRQRGRRLLAVCLLWPSYLALYLALFLQTFYLAMPFYVLLLLAALGTEHVARSLRARFPAGTHARLAVVLAPALAIVVLAAHPFRLPRPIPDLARSGEARTAAFLQQTLPRGARVAAYAPLAVRMAKMDYVPLYLDWHSTEEYGLLQMDDSRALLKWLTQNRVQVVYMDYQLQWFRPRLYRLLEDGLRNGDLVEIFHYEDPTEAKIKYLRTDSAAGVQPVDRMVMVAGSGGMVSDLSG